MAIVTKMTQFIEESRFRTKIRIILLFPLKVWVSHGISMSWFCMGIGLKCTFNFIQCPKGRVKAIFISSPGANT